MSTHAKESSRGVVAELRALLDKATHGPWDVSNKFDATQRQVSHPRGFICSTNQGNDENNAALIAALRNAAPDLLRVVEAVAKQDPKDDEGVCAFCHADPDLDQPHSDDCEWSLAVKLTGGAT